MLYSSQLVSSCPVSPHRLFRCRHGFRSGVGFRFLAQMNPCSTCVKPCSASSRYAFRCATAISLTRLTQARRAPASSLCSASPRPTAFASPTPDSQTGWRRCYGKKTNKTSSVLLCSSFWLPPSSPPSHAPPQALPHLSSFSPSPA